MPKSKTSYLVDVNVWLAIAYDQHLHHEPAVEWFEGLDRQCACLCRVTQMGLLRLLTQEKVMGRDTRSQSKAWSVVDALLDDERVWYAGEPSAMDRDFRSLTKSSHASANLWTDAYLAAFSRAAGLYLATFDKALGRLAGASAHLLV